MKKLIKYIIYCIQLFGSIFIRKEIIYIYAPNIEESIINEIKSRVFYYRNNHNSENVKVIKCRYSLKIISSNALLVLGVSNRVKNLINRRKNTFYIDYVNNYEDAWQWAKFSLFSSEYSIDIDQSKEVFLRQVEKLKQLDLSKSYILGTGPSLENAINMDWSDGYRIVCNTIVRDQEMWNHIKPHFIVAGDAIYHFGFSQFAKSFRRDLRNRLNETDTYFIYPDLFHHVVMNEFADLSEKLIPIPMKSSQNMIIDFEKDFSLPSKGNVLNLLLLPIACYLSKDVFMYGFDGRSPDDKLFWSNSLKHSYPEYMDELIKNHPAFFDHFVPKSNPQKYVASVHGNSLDNDLLSAENLGWKFTMMHFSWTETLQKRFKN